MRMTFRLSLTRPGSSRVLDVTVDADHGDTAADLATALAEVWPGQPGGTIPGLVVDGRAVAPDTPVGVPPLLDGAGVQLSDDPVATTPGRRPAAAALRLDVVAGPDAGRSYPLTPGRHVVGRDASCDVAVDDPGLSRRHTAVEVSAEGVRAEDLGSTNGTVVDGRPVTAATLTPGTELLLGGSRLAVRTTVDAPPAARTAAGDGTWTVHRSPALARPSHGASFELPREPLPPAPVRMPWLVMLLPLPVCAVLAFLWGPQLLAFALLGPLMSGGTTWSDRRAGRRRYATERAAYDTERRAVEESVAAALAAERAASAARHPDAAQTLRAALGPTRQLWDRGTDDPVVLRLGIGDSPSATVVVDPVSHRPVAQTLMDSPFVLDLSAAGVVGLCGPPRSREALCRTLLGQLAVRHSPADVVLHVVGPAEESSWTRWLPHVERPTGPVASSVAALLRRLDARSGRRDAGRPRDALPVVVLTGTPRPLEATATADGPGAAATASAAEVPGVRGSPVVDALCTHALEGRCIVVALGDAAADLPPQCRAVVELTPSDRAGRAILTVAGQSPRRFVPDGVDAAWAERLARALAPLRDPRARAATLPTSVGLAECLAVDVDDPEGLSVAWAADRPGLDAVVGWDRQGPHVVDLVTDGPHALVGGTTGAGKSELLRSLVAGLAARHSPERLSFVLVDYKGGAAFRECADLPHTAAVVTDLDLHLARRALVGLTAELRRREHVLAARGARDIEELNADPGPAGPLPRLVIVVDELKMLVEELPEFVEGLVRLAALGRSLGLHLVLATQRPAGAITADIQANVNLRIALRVRDRLDSEHVIAAPDAALLPDDVPGRAVASTGSGPLLTFQTAHPGATTPRSRGIRVTRTDAAPGTEAGEGSSDLARLVATARTVARRDGMAAAAAPWLPPLPAALPVAGLPQRADAVAIGLIDDPARQVQSVWSWSPAECAVLGVTGPPGSGRTTLVRTLVAGAIALGPPVPVQVYAVDAGRSLTALESLPQVGAVVDAEDLSRLRSLLTGLTEEVSRRRRLLTARGLTRLEEWHTSAPEEAPAWLLLVVDGWDALADTATADHELLVLTERLRGLLEDGRAVGLGAVVTGGRGLLVGAAARMCTTRVALGRLDPGEASLAGLPRRDGTERPPGRGQRLEDGLEVQVAHLGADPSGGAQMQAIHRLAADLPSSDACRPFTVGRLPDVVALSELPATQELLVGRDENGLAVGFRPADDGRRLLVAGPRGSGRTTALATIAARCAATGLTTVLVSARPGASAPEPPLTRLGPDEVERLVSTHRADPRLAVLVDDAEQLLGTTMDVALTELAARVERDGGLLVCAADSAVIGTLFRGVVAEVARPRTGLLLAPTGPLDGDVFGLRLPRAREPHAGRGHLVLRGASTALQVACPDPLLTGVSASRP